MLSRTAILASLVVMLGGCASGTTTRDVLVRDGRTQTPVDGAVIRTEPRGFFVPDPYFEFATIDPFAPSGMTTQSDADGRAVLTIPQGVPTQIRIFAPGYPFLDVSLEDLSDWTPTDATEAGVDRDEAFIQVKIDS